MSWGYFIRLAMSEIWGNDGPMSIPKSQFLPTKSKRLNLQRKYREIYPAMISFDSPRISICHYQIIPSAAQIPKVAISKNSKTATKFDGISHGISSCSSILTIRGFTFYLRVLHLGSLIHI